MPPVQVRAHPHGSHNHPTRDVPERQILVHFPADAMLWHHRLLMVRVSGAKWIVATPTQTVEQIDLTTERVAPLERNCPFPRDDRPYFGFGDLTDGELDSLRNRANQLAEILGVEPSGAAAASGPVAVWRFADTAHPSFGQIVPGHTLANNNTFEARERGSASARRRWGRRRKLLELCGTRAPNRHRPLAVGETNRSGKGSPTLWATTAPRTTAPTISRSCSALTGELADVSSAFGGLLDDGRPSGDLRPCAVRG
jgi:hypothetical protein